MSLVSDAIQQAGGESLIAKKLSPLPKRQIGGENDGDALMQGRTELKKQLCARRRKGDIAQFVEDDELVAKRLIEKTCQSLLILSLMEFVNETRHGIKTDALPTTTGI